MQCNFSSRVVLRYISRLKDRCRLFFKGNYFFTAEFTDFLLDAVVFVLYTKTRILSNQYSYKCVWNINCTNYLPVNNLTSNLRIQF